MLRQMWTEIEYKMFWEPLMMYMWKSTDMSRQTFWVELTRWCKLHYILKFSYKIGKIISEHPVCINSSLDQSKIDKQRNKSMSAFKHEGVWGVICWTALGCFFIHRVEAHGIPRTQNSPGYETKRTVKKGGVHQQWGREKLGGINNMGKNDSKGRHRGWTGWIQGQTWLGGVTIRVSMIRVLIWVWEVSVLHSGSFIPKN